MQHHHWVHGESFYKIINAFIMETGLLRIPKKFVAKHENSLPNEVVLQVPSGMVWGIKVRKVDGYVCLESGWREFMEYHSVFVGHFLVFSYDWNSQFAVLIFNMSGNEIEYLSCSNNIRQADHVQDAAHPTPEEDNSFAKGDSSSRHIETEESDTPSAFNSNYPFFKVNVTPYYANRKCMTMPIMFYRSHIPEGTDRLTLQCSNGKKNWLVRCSLNWRGTGVRISGLAGFISENNIKAGDICFFELIDRMNVVLKANILSLADAEDSSTRAPVKIREDDTAPASNTEFRSNHPFFKTNVAPTYMDRGYMHMPPKFYNTYMLGKLSPLELQNSDGIEKWPVRLSKSGRQVMMRGLSAFMSKSNFKVGDMCYFELIDKKKGILKARKL